MVSSISGQWPFRIHDILVSLHQPLQFRHQLSAIRATGPDRYRPIKSKPTRRRTGSIHRDNGLVIHLFDPLLLSISRQDCKFWLAIFKVAFLFILVSKGWDMIRNKTKIPAYQVMTTEAPSRSNLAKALLLVIFSFEGWENANFVSEVPRLLFQPN